MSELIPKFYTIEEYFPTQVQFHTQNRGILPLRRKLSIPQLKKIMSTSDANSEHPWDAVNDIFQSLERRTDFNFQTTYLYDMEYIFLTKYKCS